MNSRDDHLRSVSIATSDGDALRWCLVRGVADTRGYGHGRRVRLAHARETDVDAHRLRRHVLIRPALRLNIVRGGSEVGGRSTMGNDELAEARDLLSRCDERIGQSLVLCRQELDLGLQVL